MDEAARLHELINRVLHVKWVFVYAPFAGAFFMACVYYLFKSKNRTLRNWIIGGLVVFATGGMGLELMKYLFKHQLPFRQYVEFAVEEGLEMIGTIMVLTGCIQELNRLKGRNEMLES